MGAYLGHYGRNHLILCYTSFGLQQGTQKFNAPRKSTILPHQFIKLKFMCTLVITLSCHFCFKEPLKHSARVGQSIVKSQDKLNGLETVSYSYFSCLSVRSCALFINIIFNTNMHDMYMYTCMHTQAMWSWWSDDEYIVRPFGSYQGNATYM